MRWGGGGRAGWGGFGGLGEVEAGWGGRGGGVERAGRVGRGGAHATNPTHSDPARSDPTLPTWEQGHSQQDLPVHPVALSPPLQVSPPRVRQRLRRRTALALGLEIPQQDSKLAHEVVGAETIVVQHADAQLALPIVPGGVCVRVCVRGGGGTQSEHCVRSLDSHLRTAASSHPSASAPSLPLGVGAAPTFFGNFSGQTIVSFQRGVAVGSEGGFPSLLMLRCLATSNTSSSLSVRKYLRGVHVCQRQVVSFEVGCSTERQRGRRPSACLGSPGSLARPPR